MGRNSQSLQYALIKRVLPAKKNNKTGTAYKKSIKKFAQWAKDAGFKHPEEITQEVVQEYEKYLESSPVNYAPATIHSYLAPVCDSVGVSMRQIRKPRRTARAIIRGRDRDADGRPLNQNPQGRRQEMDPKFARLVAAQKAIGIRRAELGKLVGADLISAPGPANDGDGLYVRIRRGKGGKEQMQYILPTDVETVRQVFDGIAPSQKVFSDKEMDNKINLHRLRAKHGQDCYSYYAGMIADDPGAAERLRGQLLARWEKGHERLRTEDPKTWEWRRERFITDCDDRPYLLRGENLRKAQALDLPDEYVRLALMCVSVYHLSHWRLDVSITNYMIQ